MGKYADIKFKRIRHFLNFLSKKDGVSIESGGKHQMNIKHFTWGRPYPISTKHGVVNKHIVNDLVELLLKNGICNQDEIDKYL